MNKAVFLDRDGTINREIEYLSKVEDFEFLPNVITALMKLSSSPYKIIVVTNQSAIARGFLDIPGLEEIHKHMTGELSKNKVRVDKLYYCPHHPDDDCECRKPKAGMLREAAREFNIDLSKSYMVGDSTRDIQTGINAGCKTILVKTGYAGKDGSYDVKPDYVAEDLKDAVEIILRKA
ncbi:MAG: D-glycero-beta-D-manno-heptose 1,7-bisphosphate 7-phosphatase [Candidatus Altiarchaeota archaeon]|nr:D-glycero-beta-D-manno-heptose 1,7-bisphosphate 7-phosphatase [Candidatus Altiarchaeota archaeon]